MSGQWHTIASFRRDPESVRGKNLERETIRRVIGLCRPYRRQLWGSLVFAWAAMGMTVLIPYLIGQAINAIEQGDKPDLLPLAAAITVAGILRIGLTSVRRIVAGRVCDVTGLDKGAVSRSLHDMGKRGLVETRADATDQRRQLVALTRKGVTLHDRIVDIAVAREAQLLAGARVLEDVLGVRGTTPIDPRQPK